MSKSSKSQNPEFLQKRRNAIVELAKRRGQGRGATPGSASLRPNGQGPERGRLGKVVTAPGFAARPQPQG